MNDFPEFMKGQANRIVSGSQATPGVEGYVFDGADGSQMAFWTCHETAVSVPHVHEFDEYMIVVEGCYTIIIEGKKIELRPGEEFFIPQGSLAWRRGRRGDADDSCFRRLASGAGESNFFCHGLTRIRTERCNAARR